MSSDGYSKTLRISNRHSDNYQRKVGSGAVTPVVMPILRFKVT